jgi:hypothetical protein
MILREAGRRSEDDALRRCSTNGRERGRMTERAFGFLRINERESKPRSRGLTEIRGLYYTPVGRRYLEDLFVVALTRRVVATA